MNLGHCMKISIGSKIFTGPWGGGNLFAKNLTNYLINLGHDVIHDLYDDDIDLILLTDPRQNNANRYPGTYARQHPDTGELIQEHQS